MIRPLITSDVPALVDLLEVMAVESIYSDFGLHRDRTTFILADIIGKPEVFARGEEKDGKIVSILLGEIKDHLFFDGSVASELLMYAHPKHRKGMGSKRLVEAFCAWAEERGADFAQFEASVGIDNTRAGRFFTICGLPECGTVHSRRL